MLAQISLVALGGACGSVLRFLIGLLAARLATGPMPWGTLAVNIAGSFLAGLALVRFGATPDHPLRALLVVGALGGFTTFSAFAAESVSLAQRGMIPAAFVNVATTLVLCLAAAAAGAWCAR